MVEYKREYYNSGELEKEYFEINEKKEGEFKSYYKNGEIQEICTYIDGKRNGEYKYYFPDGSLTTIGTFVNDNKNGEFKYYSDNVLVDSCIYINGVRKTVDEIEIEKVLLDIVKKKVNLIFYFGLSNHLNTIVAKTLVLTLLASFVRPSGGILLLGKFRTLSCNLI